VVFPPNGSMVSTLPAASSKQVHQVPGCPQSTRIPWSKFCNPLLSVTCTKSSSHFLVSVEVKSMRIWQYEYYFISTPIYSYVFWTTSSRAMVIFQGPWTHLVWSYGLQPYVSPMTYFLLDYCTYLWPYSHTVHSPTVDVLLVLRANADCTNSLMYQSNICKITMDIPWYKVLGSSSDFS